MSNKHVKIVGHKPVATISTQEKGRYGDSVKSLNRKINVVNVFN